tara:strand:- start:11110 stop:12129 length:1020 start_codon:yes stop_codon:yes gene_type:complete
MNYWFSKNKIPIIAEIGMNHEGNFDNCKKILYEALETNVDIIKFQTFETNSFINKKYSPHRHTHFDKFLLSNSQFEELANICKSRNKIFMTSFWDINSIDILDKYVPYYKVGSGDLTNYQILKKLALKNKPIIISCAMSNLEEVKKSIKFIDSINPKLIENNDLVVLHCVAMYGEPKDEYANLLSIKTLQNELNVPIGYSDHTVGTYACELAISMGAKLIEVHFTDNNKNREFRDHEISLTKNELQYLLDRRDQIQVLLGKYGKFPIEPIENENRITEFRRALYLNKNMKEGDIISENDIIALRPRMGIPAEYYDKLIGKKIKKDVIEYLEKLDFSYFY